MQQWETYFVAQVGASAALTGLVFVALSINLSKIIDEPTLVGRAAEAVYLLVMPMVLGFALISPQDSQRATGAWCLAISLVSVAFVARVVYAARTNLGTRRAIYVQRCLTVSLATVPAVVGSLLLVTGSGNGLGWLAFTGVTALVVGISDAWVLLIEILR